MDYNIKAYLEDIGERLSPKRYRHSLRVAESARALAERYGGDPDAAYAAGILHDAWKEADRGEILAYLADRGVALSPVERACPKLWHAMAGAEYIRSTYALPEEIVRAVRYHTTGRAGMTLPERILFVADFISEDRTYPGVKEMRVRAERSLASAMEEGLRFTIFELSEKGRPIHPDTVAAYNEILLEGDKTRG